MGNEFTIQYIKKEIQKFEGATSKILKERKKLEEQNVLFQRQKKDLQFNIESYTNSLELKNQIIATLQQQTAKNQIELSKLREKCANTVDTYQKEYEGIKETLKNKHPLYKEYSELVTSNLKSEDEIKNLKTKISDLKNERKRRLEENRQKFNQSIVKFVQAVQDNRKRYSQMKETNSKVDNLQRDSINKTKTSQILLELETFSSTFKSFSTKIPLTNFVAPLSTDNYNIDQIVLQIQARNEQRQKEWQQRPSFSLNKRRSSFKKNDINSKSPRNHSTANTDNMMDFKSQKETTSVPEPMPIAQTKNDISSFQVAMKQQMTLDNIIQSSNGKRATSDVIPKSNKINIIDVQSFSIAKEKEQDTTSMYLSRPLSSGHLSEQKDSESLIADYIPAPIHQSPDFNQTQETLPYIQNTLNNPSKPDLIVSQFFARPKTMELTTNLQNENYQDLSVQNMLSSYGTEPDNSFHDERYMNFLSPMNSSTDGETDANKMSCFDLGQSNTNQPNIPQVNMFGRTSSNFFDMFS